jgi:hypothetical protein
MRPLTAYRIHLSNGTSYATNMAHNVTLEDAKDYFHNASIEQADERTFLRVVDVTPA